MSKWALRITILICPLVLLAGQDIDANITTQNRRPSTIADQISDPAERTAFLALFQETQPKQMLERVKAFLSRFPQSAFLFQAYEMAARASFALEDFDAGLNYAKQSLTLLPENPLLLVSVADVEAQKHLNDAAISDARDAIEYFDRFSAPGAVAPDGWQELKNKLKATAEFAEGRALLEKALALPKGEKRDSLLKDCKASLAEAQMQNPSDSEIIYLFGLVEFTSGELNSAARKFAKIYRANGGLASKARENLQKIYAMLALHDSFESFVTRAETQDSVSSSQIGVIGNPTVQSKADYAGSNSCQGCHTGVYRQWSQTGMSKMLRPYAPQNVIGDFQNSNEFYLEDEAADPDGKAESVKGQGRALFARMVIRDGRHYFDVQQSDGRLHTYPVDYTIGSKFQQAYATRLPSGEIHVFPIQYSALQKRWINYWKIIDGSASERSDVRAWERLTAATSYQAVCAVCHTSQLRNVKGGGFDVNNVEFKEPGVDCEMCHGPSAQHVMEMTTSEEPYPKRAIESPVNFHDLGNRDFIRICAQCHMQSAIRAPGPSGELNYARSDEFFQNSLSIPFGEFSRIGFYKDGRFRQTTFIVEALQRSQCFRKGQVSCGTCHDPHGHDAASNLTSVKFRDQPDLMCTNCHSRFQSGASVAAHTHHRVDSEGSRCVSCHMPRIMDAVLFRARTHQIDDIPNADMTQRFGQEESPNACLLCHSEKNAGWVKEKLAAWRPAPRS